MIERVIERLSDTQPMVVLVQNLYPHDLNRP